MATQSHNPFVLPGFGQSGDLSQNPLMASMEMMRQAWEGLAGAGGFDAAKITPSMSLEEFDRRISDLRAVENWLRMNLSMLSSTIQGLEVQRATIATLKSFVSGAGAGMAAAAAAAAPAAGQAAASQAEGADSYAAQATAAAQGWWDMLQQQFDALATATSATLQGAEAMRAAAQQGMAGESKAPPAAKRATRSAAKAGDAAGSQAKAAAGKRRGSGPSK
ncbi:MAG: transcriptional regulator [Alcaligenaceae bacterium]|nr:transcriptional regulator [Alcaligenaceae bacterium]